MSTVVVEARAWCEHCPWRESGTEIEVRHQAGVHSLIHSGGPKVEVVAAAEPGVEVDEEPEPAAEITNGSAPRGRRYRWTRESSIEAIQRKAEELGRPPRARDFNGARDLPGQGTLRSIFGSFADAIEAAGFPRPVRGGRGEERAARDRRARERTGAAEDVAEDARHRVVGEAETVRHIEPGSGVGGASIPLVELAQRVDGALVDVVQAESDLDVARTALRSALERLEIAIEEVWLSAARSAAPDPDDGDET